MYSWFFSWTSYPTPFFFVEKKLNLNKLNELLFWCWFSERFSIWFWTIYVETSVTDVFDLQLLMFTGLLSLGLLDWLVWFLDWFFVSTCGLRPSLAFQCLKAPTFEDWKCLRTFCAVHSMKMGALSRHHNSKQGLSNFKSKKCCFLVRPLDVIGYWIHW